MSLYAYHENAPVATAAADADIMPLTQGGVLSQIPVSAFRNSGGGVVNTTATTLAVTQATHGNRTVTVSSAASITITLPQATGTGTTYRFVMQVAATGTSSKIQVANATDVMQGLVLALTTASANVIGYGTSATSDTISLNGTTTGGVAGAMYEIRDIKTGFFQVVGYDSPTGTTATPFSAAV